MSILFLFLMLTLFLTLALRFAPRGGQNFSACRVVIFLRRHQIATPLKINVHWKPVIQSLMPYLGIVNA
jgi:hypothetical protein